MAVVVAIVRQAGMATGDFWCRLFCAALFLVFSVLAVGIAVWDWVRRSRRA
jgi:hypothetical protein